jgi:hypothetical protein
MIWGSRVQNACSLRLQAPHLVFWLEFQVSSRGCCTRPACRCIAAYQASPSWAAAFHSAACIACSVLPSCSINRGAPLESSIRVWSSMGVELE